MPDSIPSLLVLSCLAALLINSAESASTNRISCDRCRTPTFQGKEFYLPFCTKSADEEIGTTHTNVCKAICVQDAEYSKGSCDGCENKCSPVFLPVCSKDQKILYANKCHAKCALGEDSTDYEDCKGINMIIPGKSPLPPNKELPNKLQSIGAEEASQDLDADDTAA